MTKDIRDVLKLALEALVMYGERHRATYLLGGAWDEEITLGDKAITAIKEALAQPDDQLLVANILSEYGLQAIDFVADFKEAMKQAEQEHPAPCARHCEATAFQITIKNLEAKLAQRTCLGIRGEALLMAEPYIVEALARHDEAYDRHPATEAERQIIVDDLEALRKALQQLELEPVAWFSPSGNLYKTRFHAAANGEQVVTPLYTGPPQRKPLTLDRYDAGLLNDFGGGNVDWWWDYLRAELDRAHDFYQTQVAHGIKENT